MDGLGLFPTIWIQGKSYGRSKMGATIPYPLRLSPMVGYILSVPMGVSRPYMSCDPRRGEISLLARRNRRTRVWFGVRSEGVPTCRLLSCMAIICTWVITAPSGVSMPLQANLYLWKSYRNLRRLSLLSSPRMERSIALRSIIPCMFSRLDRSLSPSPTTQWVNPVSLRLRYPKECYIFAQRRV